MVLYLAAYAWLSQAPRAALRSAAANERDALVRDVGIVLEDLKSSEGVDLTARWQEILASSQDAPQGDVMNALIDALSAAADEAGA